MLFRKDSANYRVQSMLTDRKRKQTRHGSERRGDARWAGCPSCGITLGGVDEVVEMPAGLVSITLSLAETGDVHPEHSEDC